MVCDGTEGGQITIERAAALTGEFRKVNRNASCKREGHLFGREKIEALLGQTGCMGIRIYHGIDPNTSSKEVILVGVDSAGNDMTNMILDLSLPCPDRCSNGNALNGR
jgi:hypothetical protein